jgi:hypothetical protein
LDAICRSAQRGAPMIGQVYYAMFFFFGGISAVMCFRGMSK